MIETMARAAARRAAIELAQIYDVACGFRTDRGEFRSPEDIARNARLGELVAFAIDRVIEAYEGER